MVLKLHYKNHRFKEKFRTMSEYRFVLYFKIRKLYKEIKYNSKNEKKFTNLYKYKIIS